MAVTVEGVALSSLLYEHNNSSGDQEGFLLGEIVSRVTDTISDSQINNVKEEIVTYIHSHLPCRGLFSWYSDDGHIIHEKIRELLKNNKHKEVVGWYKFRRNSSTIVSLRERAVHRHLKDVFPNVPASNFLLCLSVTLTEANAATHTFSHTFFSFNGRSFQGVPVTVVNLGDTLHSDYKTTSSTAVSDTFHKTVQPFEQTFLDRADNLHSAVHIHSMNARLQQRLVEVCSDVVLSETRLSQLSAEVKRLRDQVNSGQPYHVEQLRTVHASSKAPMLWDTQSRAMPKERLAADPRSKVAPLDASLTPEPSASLQQDVCEVSADESGDDSNDAMALDTPDLIAFDEDSRAGVDKSPDSDVNLVNGDVKPVVNIVSTPKPAYSVGVPAHAVKTRPHDDTVRTNLVSSGMSVSPSTSPNGASTHDDSRVTLGGNKDAFAFVEDLLSRAKPVHKSPPLTNMQVTHSLDLDTKLGQVARRGQHVTRSKSDVYEEGRKQRTRRTDESLVGGASGVCAATRADRLKRSQMKAVDEGDTCVMHYDRSGSPTF